MSRKPAAGKARARRPAITRRAPSPLRRAGDLLALAAIGAHAGLLWLLAHAVGVPAWLPLAWALLSAITLATYAHDKRAAGRQAQRVPESRLHLLELAGGWPGALLAQRWLRHKNRKPSYQWGFWSCVVAHEALLLALWRWLAQMASG